MLTVLTVEEIFVPQRLIQNSPSLLRKQRLGPKPTTAFCSDKETKWKI